MLIMYTIEVTVLGDDNTCVFIEEFELLVDIVFPEIILDETYTINCESSAQIDIYAEAGSTWNWKAESSELFIENEINVIL